LELFSEIPYLILLEFAAKLEEAKRREREVPVCFTFDEKNKRFLLNLS